MAKIESKDILTADRPLFKGINASKDFIILQDLYLHVLVYIAGIHVLQEPVNTNTSNMREII